MAGHKNTLLTAVMATGLVVLAVTQAERVRAAGPDEDVSRWPKMSAPQLREVRWQTFDKKVDYAVVDAKGRTWFLLKDKKEKHPQYVCPDVPDAHLMLSGCFRTFGVDAQNRFWIAKLEGLYYFDLNDFRKVTKELKGLFTEDPDTGWPMYHPGQFYWDHSSGRVYCHDRTGIHVLGSRRWTFRKWPAEVLGSTGRVDLAGAEFQAVEGPGGIAIFWAIGDRLKGFWTHDGTLWRHYSSKTNPALRDITAVVPMSRRFVLVCSVSQNAFVVDLASGASTAIPETAVIITHLMRLGHKDPKVRAEAKGTVREMSRVNSKKITEVAGFIDDARLRKTALSVIRNTPRGGGQSKQSDIPPGPKCQLLGGRLIVRTPAGDALLTWIADGRKKMGVLLTGGQIVSAPTTMSLKMRDRPAESCRATADGSIIISTGRIWKFSGRKFKLLCDESVTAMIKLLGVDRFGRVFMESPANCYVRAMCDPRYKGVVGAGIVTARPVKFEIPDIQIQTRD